MHYNNKINLSLLSCFLCLFLIKGHFHVDQKHFCIHIDTDLSPSPTPTPFFFPFLPLMKEERDSLDFITMVTAEMCIKLEMCQC